MNRILAPFVLLCSLALGGCVFPAGPPEVGHASASPTGEVPAAVEAEATSSNPPSASAEEGQAKIMTAAETCREWRNLMGFIAFGAPTAEDVLIRATKVSAGAPAELKAESATAAEAITYTTLNKHLGRDMGNAEQALVQLRAACKAKASIDIIP